MDIFIWFIKIFYWAKDWFMGSFFYFRIKEIIRNIGILNWIKNNVVFPMVLCKMSPKKQSFVEL